MYCILCLCYPYIQSLLTLWYYIDLIICLIHHSPVVTSRHDKVMSIKGYCGFSVSASFWTGLIRGFKNPKRFPSAFFAALVNAVQGWWATMQWCRSFIEKKQTKHLHGISFGIWSMMESYATSATLFISMDLSSIACCATVSATSATTATALLTPKCGNYK